MRFAKVCSARNTTFKLRAKVYFAVNTTFYDAQRLGGGGGVPDQSEIATPSRSIDPGGRGAMAPERKIMRFNGPALCIAGRSMYRNAADRHGDEYDNIAGNDRAGHWTLKKAENVNQNGYQSSTCRRMQSRRPGRDGWTRRARWPPC